MGAFNYEKISFWERESFFQYDYIIVGSGIVGCMTALHLREKYPTAKIIIVERGLLPTGASTRNAGFACIGSIAEIVSDIKTMGKQKANDLVTMRYKGLQKLRTIVGDENMDFNNCGGYELLQSNETQFIDNIDAINESLQNEIGIANNFYQNDHLINTFHFNKNKFKHLIVCRCDGHIHTGKLMQTLLAKCMQQQIEIKTNCEVVKVESSSNKAEIIIHDKWRNDIRLQAQHVLICTNAFTKQLFPEEDTIPARGQVMITKPFSTAPFVGTFHFDEGYYYFRNVENKILLGGARNEDFEGETSTEFEQNDQVFTKLYHVLQNDILPHQKFEIEQSWSGIMCFGNEKYPIVKTIQDRIHIGVRMSGMGVAISSIIGEKLSDMIVQ